MEIENLFSFCNDFSSIFSITANGYVNYIAIFKELHQNFDRHRIGSSLKISICLIQKGDNLRISLLLKDRNESVHNFVFACLVTLLH